MTTLMAGAAETVITSIKDRSDVYAELYARVLVLADDETQLAIVTADYGQFLTYLPYPFYVPLIQ